MRPTRAGSRQTKYRSTIGLGRLSDEKVGILVTSVTRQLAIQSLDPQQWDEENDVELNSEQGENIVLLISVPGRRNPLTWNISGMTTEELEATRKFFEYLFDMAAPIVRERDRVAKHAFDNGDDSYARAYRGLPQLVTRPRKKRADGEGVHDRPEDAPPSP